MSSSSSQHLPFDQIIRQDLVVGGRDVDLDEVDVEFVALALEGGLAACHQALVAVADLGGIDLDFFAGLQVFELHGSKTPGELALLIEGHTLVTGDLVRGQRAGRLNLLPDAKLQDRERALESLRRLTEVQSVEAVLVGDGWPVFHGGRHALTALLIELEGPNRL